MTDSAQELASRWKRLVGAMLDSIFSMIASVPVMITAGVFKQITLGQQMSIGQRAFFLIFGLAIFLMINGYLLARHGQTVGKKLVGTRIVSNADGKLLSLGHVFGLRYVPLPLITSIPVFGQLFILADCLFIFREDKRCIHDLIAGTKVINS